MPWKNVMDRSADAMPEHLGAFNPSDWSLVNFILELKDLKPLLKKYHTKRSFFRSFLQYFNEGITIEGILALIGSQYLEVKFGIEPFFQDLSTILDKLNTFDERFENYLSHRGKDLHRNLISGGGILSLPGPKTGKCVIEGVDVAYRVEYNFVPHQTYCRSSLYYSWTCPELACFRGRLRARLDDLGVRLDPQVVWNAIPFSFVVDWFYNVGDWLGTFRIENFDVDVTIKDFLLCGGGSIQRNVSCDVIAAPGSVRTPTQVTCDTQILRWYMRKRNRIPVHRDKVPILKPLTLRKLTLGAALLAANGDALSRPFAGGRS
jgi:hypothetical protein